MTTQTATPPRPKIERHTKKYPVPTFWLETKYGNLILTLLGSNALSIKNNTIPDQPFTLNRVEVGVDIKYVRLTGDEWGVDPQVKNPANAIRFYDRATPTKRVGAKVADKALTEINDCLGGWLSYNEELMSSAEAVRLYNEIFERQHKVEQLRSQAGALLDSIVADQAKLKGLLAEGATLESPDPVESPNEEPEPTAPPAAVPPTIAPDPVTPAPKKTKLELARDAQARQAATQQLPPDPPDEPDVPRRAAERPATRTGPLSDAEYQQGKADSAKARQEAADRTRAKEGKGKTQAPAVTSVKAPVVARPPIVPAAQPPADLADEEEDDLDEFTEEENPDEFVDETDSEDGNEETEEEEDDLANQFGG